MIQRDVDARTLGTCVGNFEITDGRAFLIMVRLRYSYRARLQQAEMWRAVAVGGTPFSTSAQCQNGECVDRECTSGVLVEGSGCKCGPE